MFDIPLLCPDNFPPFDVHFCQGPIQSPDFSLGTRSHNKKKHGTSRFHGIRKEGFMWLQNESKEGMLEEGNECSKQDDHQIIVKQGIRKLGLRNQEKGIRKLVL